MNTAAERDAEQCFETHRPALTGLAYRMLGSRAEAEDVVQDAFLRWHAADRDAIEAPRRYLGTVVTRLCLDRLKSARARQFRMATETGDTQTLRRLLAEDAVLYTDGGGKRPAAHNPIYGADKILRFLAGIVRKNPALPTIQVRAATINGLAGFVLREQDGSLDTMAFEHRDGRIVAIYVARNPDKLRHVRF